MPDLDDFQAHPLEPWERRQHRLMWHERGIDVAERDRKERQRKAWQTSLGIILPLLSLLMALAVFLWGSGLLSRGPLP